MVRRRGDNAPPGGGEHEPPLGHEPLTAVSLITLHEASIRAQKAGCPQLDRPWWKRLADKGGITLHGDFWVRLGEVDEIISHTSPQGGKTDAS